MSKLLHALKSVFIFNTRHNERAERSLVSTAARVFCYCAIMSVDGKFDLPTAMLDIETICLHI